MRCRQFILPNAVGGSEVSYATWSCSWNRGECIYVNHSLDARHFLREVGMDSPAPARYVVLPSDGMYMVYDRQLLCSSENTYTRIIADALAADLNETEPTTWDINKGYDMRAELKKVLHHPTTVGVFSEEDLIWLQYGLHIVVEQSEAAHA